MPRALITGASTGIGKALAYQFAHHGYDVVLVARNEAALAEVARGLPSGNAEPAARPPSAAARGRATGGQEGHPQSRVQIITADLAKPSSAADLLQELSRRDLTIDVLVNNAGFGLQGEFAELSLPRQVEMIQLNVTTLTELTHLVLPAMLERRTGGILNVASTAAFQPGPLMSVYYATKAYVLSFTEGLAEELAGSGIKVSCLCPGPTATEFAERAAMTQTNLFRGAVMDAEAVAREGFEGWSAGKIVIVPGFSNRRGATLVRFAPRSFVRRVVKRLNSQRSA